MGKECQSCGTVYKKLGSHLARSDCEYPEFSERQKEIIEGMMLGDGWVNHQHKGNGKPFFAVGMTNWAFLQWLNDEMWPHSTGVKDATGSQNSTKPYYKVRTMRTPKLRPYADWYESGSLELRHIELTPLSFKMWYVSDGWLCYQDDMVRPVIVIGNRIATDRDEYFKNLFKPLGVEPWVGEDTIRFGVENTEQLFDYMGPPPVGFTDKWPQSRKAKQDENQSTL